MIKAYSYGALMLLACCFTPPAAALKLIDGANFVYDIETDGRLNQGTRGAYAGMYRLRVNGTNYSGEVATISPDGRKAITSGFIEPSSGLEVTRQIYVPANANFARYTEVLHNPEPTPKIASVEVFGALGSSAPKVLFDQSYYLITDDYSNGAMGGAPVLLHYHSQIGNPIKANHMLTGNNLSWRYPNLEIPALGTVRVSYYVAQAKDFNAAREIADSIFRNQSELHDAMTMEARSQVLNFVPMMSTSTRDFLGAPILTPGEVRIGSLDSGDPGSRQRAATPSDVYALRLAEGEQVTVRMAAAFDTYLYLYGDSAGQRLLTSNNDANPATTHSELVFTAPAAGMYYLEATAYTYTARSLYSLQVEAGRLNRAPQIKPINYTYGTLTAPVNVRFRDFSTDLDGQIVEYCWNFGDGSEILCSASASVNHVFSAPGYFTVNVRLTDNQGAVSQHSERVAVRSGEIGVVLPIDSVTGGELVFGDAYSRTRPLSLADRYTIASLPVGSEVVIDMASTEFDGYLYLYDTFGQLLRQDDNSGGNGNPRLVFVPQQAGNYSLEATSLNSNVIGGYTISLKLNQAQETLQAPLDVFAADYSPLKNYFLLRLPENIDASYAQWDFGDGSPKATTNGTVASHVYPRTGNYTVRVNAISSDGRSISSSKLVSLNTQDAHLNAKFRASPIFGDKPLRVYFSNESSSSLVGDSLSYAWDFGDGQVSTDPSPNHLYTEPNTYNVVLTVTSQKTRQSASSVSQVIVIERNRADIPVSDTARLRPQVLMAGFDPILVDMADTELTVFAIVRPGAAPLQSVLLNLNPGQLVMALYHAETYPNGDQRYETVIPFSSGQFVVGTLGDLLSNRSGEFSIQAIDQAGQFHAYPNLEVGDYPAWPTPAASRYAAPMRRAGVRRGQPQVLGAGFGTPLIDLSETQAEFIALVREGLYPIESVAVEINGVGFRLPMHLRETLPNGDKVFQAIYPYPLGTLGTMTAGELFGSQYGELSVRVTDLENQSHSFPQLKFGNYPQR